MREERERKGPGGRGGRDERQRNDDIRWGRQVVLQLLRESPDRVQKVYLGKNVSMAFSRQIQTLAAQGRIVVQSVTPEVLGELCGTVNHQGVACRSGEASIRDLHTFLPEIPKEKPAMLMLLDHVQDPHNLGAVIRSAEASGASAVLFPKRRSALPGGTVVKVSAGAALRVPLIGINNVTETVKLLQEEGFWTIGLHNERGRSLWESPLPERTLLIVGSESEGVSRLVLKTCDEIVRIPMTGGTGSLNASVAAALGMFEWARSWGGERLPG